MARTVPARHVVVVGAGKGGVGKSTVALNLALALRDHGRVGLLDADLHGPNIPLMLGLVRRDWTHEWTLARNRPAAEQPKFEPVERFGLKVMSAGFILGEDQPVGIPGSTVRLIAAQLVRDTLWGDPDYLVVDLPPGSADMLLALLGLVRLAGALIVVTPQDVAHLDARKAVRLFEHAKVPILGGVENMSGLVCPHCGEVVEVLARAPDARAIWSLGVERLGAVPLDPVISRGGDRGEPLLVAGGGSPGAEAFREIGRRVAEKLGAVS